MSFTSPSLRRATTNKKKATHPVKSGKAVSESPKLLGGGLLLSEEVGTLLPDLQGDLGGFLSPSLEKAMQAAELGNSFTSNTRMYGSHNASEGSTPKLHVRTTASTLERQRTTSVDENVPPTTPQSQNNKRPPSSRTPGTPRHAAARAERRKSVSREPANKPTPVRRRRASKSQKARKAPTPRNPATRRGSVSIPAQAQKAAAKPAVVKPAAPQQKAGFGKGKSTLAAKRAQFLQRQKARKARMEAAKKRAQEKRAATPLQASQPVAAAAPSTVVAESKERREPKDAPPVKQVAATVASSTTAESLKVQTDRIKQRCMALAMEKLARRRGVSTSDIQRQLDQKTSPSRTPSPVRQAVEETRRESSARQPSSVVKPAVTPSVTGLVGTVGVVTPSRVGGDSPERRQAAVRERDQRDQTVQTDSSEAQSGSAAMSPALQAPATNPTLKSGRIIDATSAEAVPSPALPASSPAAPSAALTPGAPAPMSPASPAQEATAPCENPAGNTSAASPEGVHAKPMSPATPAQATGLMADSPVSAHSPGVEAGVQHDASPASEADGHDLSPGKTEEARSGYATPPAGHSPDNAEPGSCKHSATPVCRESAGPQEDGVLSVRVGEKRSPSPPSEVYGKDVESPTKKNCWQTVGVSSSDVQSLPEAPGSVTKEAKPAADETKEGATEEEKSSPELRKPSPAEENAGDELSTEAAYQTLVGSSGSEGASENAWTKALLAVAKDTTQVGAPASEGCSATSKDSTETSSQADESSTEEVLPVPDMEPEQGTAVESEVVCEPAPQTPPQAAARLPSPAATTPSYSQSQTEFESPQACTPHASVLSRVVPGGQPYGSHKSQVTVVTSTGEVHIGNSNVHVTSGSVDLQKLSSSVAPTKNVSSLQTPQLAVCPDSSVPSARVVCQGNIRSVGLNSARVGAAGQTPSAPTPAVSERKKPSGAGCMPCGRVRSPIRRRVHQPARKEPPQQPQQQRTSLWASSPARPVQGGGSQPVRSQPRFPGTPVFAKPSMPLSRRRMPETPQLQFSQQGPGTPRVVSHQVPASPQTPMGGVRFGAGVQWNKIQPQQQQQQQQQQGQPVYRSAAARQTPVAPMSPGGIGDYTPRSRRAANMPLRK